MYGGIRRLQTAHNFKAETAIVIRAFPLLENRMPDHRRAILVHIAQPFAARTVVDDVFLDEIPLCFGGLTEILPLRVF